MVLSTLLAGPRYLFSGLYDENGNFSAWRSDDGSTRKSVNAKQKEDPASVMADRGTQEAYSTALAHRRDSSGSALSASSDEDAFGKDTEMLNARAEKRSAASTRSSDQSADTKDAVAGSTEEVAPRRSTRIKIASPEGARPPRARRGPPEPLRPRSGDLAAPATLKSPISPKESTARITRYPRAPAPPRPLVPQRRASYAPSTLPLYNPAHKTLILDLDETLIHSMSKGGRMGEGYMVEVRLRTSVGANGIVIGPQVPILYWVEKRPYCDEFLRKVSKWYNLIIFTASVQEYADPVIDILERERKYFSGRYYRQHCTLRAGAYVKDLSQVEPDLSKVMILDNSPVSYIFHEDNAIPIEGWINDPEDHNLLHLIPILEGLQHTTDVRSLLALRLGETGTG